MTTRKRTTKQHATTDQLAAFGGLQITPDPVTSARRALRIAEDEFNHRVNARLQLFGDLRHLDIPTLRQFLARLRVLQPEDLLYDQRQLLEESINAQLPLRWHSMRLAEARAALEDARAGRAEV